MGRGSGQSLFSAFPQVGGLLSYDVAQREPLRVTEPAHLFRRGGSLRFTIASLEITGTHNPCMLPNSQLFN